jgi:FkbM family methyltransferase
MKGPGALSSTLREMLKSLLRQELRKTIYLGDHEALTSLYTGHKIYVDTRDVGIASHLMWEGRWEAHIEACLVPFARPGMKALDIGANFGFYTLLLAQAVGPAGAVHAFEANPGIVRKLRKSVAVNGLSAWTHVHALALSSGTGETTFSFDPAFSGGGAMGANAGADYETIKVPTAPLDSILPPDLLPDMIKMDVEGAEALVLEGGRRVFDSPRLSRVVSEFYPEAIARTMPPRAFLDHFLTRGFEIRLIASDGPRVADLDQIASGEIAPMVYLLMTRNV